MPVALASTTMTSGGTRSRVWNRFCDMELVSQIKLPSTQLGRGISGGQPFKSWEICLPSTESGNAGFHHLQQRCSGRPTSSSPECLSSAHPNITVLHSFPVFCFVCHNAPFSKFLEIWEASPLFLELEQLRAREARLLAHGHTAG